MPKHSVIAITGASQGIGAALALQAARAGYCVVAVGRNGDALEGLSERVRSESGRIVTHVGDVRASETSTAVARLALEHFGRLDVLVANAGVAGRGPLIVQTDAELMEQLETHITAPITLIRECLALLIASRGTIFVLGSGVGRMPIAGMGLYPASKAGLRSAARTLRTELKPFNIGLTYVDPGAVDTDFMRRKAMPGAPQALLTSPLTVARKILRAVDRRPTELNVVPWQTALLALVEPFPRLVDFALRHAGSITGAPVLPLDSSGSTAIGRLRDAVQSQPISESIALVAGESAAANVSASDRVGSDSAADTPGAVAPNAAADPAQPPDHADPLMNILAPLLGRMSRQKLSVETLRARIDNGRPFTEEEFALDWVGMPNKNERKLIADVCQACADGGLLQKIGEEHWQSANVAALHPRA